MIPTAAPPPGGGREPVVVGTVHVDVEAAQRLEHLQDEVDVGFLEAQVEAGFARGEPFARLALFSLGALPADIEPPPGADILENEAVPEDAAGDGKAVDLFAEVVRRQGGDELLDAAMAQDGGPLAELGQEPRRGGFLVPAHGDPFRAGFFDGDQPDSRTGLHRIVGDDIDLAVLAQNGLKLSGKIATHVQEIGDLFAVEAGMREVFVLGGEELADDEQVARHVLGPVRMEVPVRQEVMFEKGVDDFADRVELHPVEVFQQVADFLLFPFSFPLAAGFDRLDFWLHGSPYETE